MFKLIASYPKSGNTYVRIFLANYLRGETDLNKIGWPIFESTKFFPLGIPKNRRVIEPFKEEFFSKTHSVAKEFYPNIVSHALYIVRNPIDVCTSYARHMSITNDAAIKALAKTSNKLRGTDKIYPQFVSDWSSHVESWLGQKKFPVFYIRYETLCANPAYSFGEILRFFEIPLVTNRFDAALEFSSFQKLKAKEEAMLEAEKEKENSKFKEARGSTGRFFNIGRPGNGKEELTPQQIALIYRDHKKVMDMLRYAPKT